jgi:hypothetical protein
MCLGESKLAERRTQWLAQICADLYRPSLWLRGLSCVVAPLCLPPGCAARAAQLRQRHCAGKPLGRGLPWRSALHGTVTACPRRERFSQVARLKAELVGALVRGIARKVEPSRQCQFGVLHNIVYAVLHPVAAVDVTSAHVGAARHAPVALDNCALTFNGGALSQSRRHESP